MGFLENLLGEQNASKVKEIAGDLCKEIEGAANNVGNAIENGIAAVNNQANANSANQSAASAATATAPTKEAAPAQADDKTATTNISWGETMPSEPNQYNYPGSYDDYFHDVFTGSFPFYRITQEKTRKGKATVFTFWRGENKCLVVELLSENSAAQKIRYECRQSGIPYLRFYYNHEGWWNTKAYVVERTKKALGQ